MNVIYEDLKALKASNLNGRNQTKTDIQIFQNTIMFKTFRSYISVFQFFQTFEYYYYCALPKIRVGQAHTTKH